MDSQRELTEKLKKNEKSKIFPDFKKENLTPPGVEEKMKLKPKYIDENYKGSDKLKGKKALITGGDSGIGRAICAHFAIEGADVAFTYISSEKKDAEKTIKIIENYGQRALAVEVDFEGEESFDTLSEKVKSELGGIDILVNNAAFQNHVDSFEDLSFEQFTKTFQVNVFSTFRLIKAVVPCLAEGSSIINTSSILGYVGDDNLIDYAATKAAIRSMTKSFSKALADKGIRVNAVAPGPVWTPLNPAERKFSEVKSFGEDTDFGRPAQPAEIAPAYVYLASPHTGSFITGETINIFGSASGGN